MERMEAVSVCLHRSVRWVAESVILAIDVVTVVSPSTGVVVVVSDPTAFTEAHEAGAPWIQVVSSYIIMCGQYLIDKHPVPDPHAVLEAD